MKRKLFTKRLRMTKQKKIVRRLSGIGHNRAKKTAKKIRSARKPVIFSQKKLLKNI